MLNNCNKTTQFVRFCVCGFGLVWVIGYVDMYLSVRKYVCTHVCIIMQALIHTCHAHMRIYTHACTHACMRTSVQARTHLCAHTPHARTLTHARSHAHTHTYARTHSHTYNHSVNHGILNNFRTDLYDSNP